jgi:MFS family permease
MDLVCANKVQTNSMISIHYIAYGISGLLFFSMTDRMGRKPTMTIMMGIHTAAQFLILFVPSYSARLIGLILYGLTQMKNTVPYVYLIELVPAKFSTSMSAGITSFDSATTAVVCIYFIFISKDWFPLFFAMTLLSLFSYLLIVFYLQESPIWLLNTGRTSDAIAAFNKIGKFNGVKERIPEDAIFSEALALAKT